MSQKSNLQTSKQVLKFYNYIRYNPNMEWDYIELSKNKYITWELMEQDPYLLWNLKAMLLYNPNTTVKLLEDILQNRKKLLKNMILKSQDFHWDLVDIRRKTRWNQINKQGPVLSKDVINKNLRQIGFLRIFVYRYFSGNPNVTRKVVKENPDKPWDYTWLSENPNISWKTIKNNPSKPWDLADHLVYNPRAVWEVFYHIPDKSAIDYKELSKKSVITWDIVQSHPEIDWDYDYLTENPIITLEIILSNPDKPWNYTILSANPIVTWDIVKTYPQIKWDYNGLSENPNITWDIVQSNKDKPWNYGIMSTNPNITWDIIQDNLILDWNFEYFSENPNVTIEIVKSNPDIAWNYHSLTRILSNQ